MKTKAIFLMMTLATLTFASCGGGAQNAETTETVSDITVVDTTFVDTTMTVVDTVGVDTM